MSRWLQKARAWEENHIPSLPNRQNRQEPAKSPEPGESPHAFKGIGHASNPETAPNPTRQKPAGTGKKPPVAEIHDLSAGSCRSGAFGERDHESHENKGAHTFLPVSAGCRVEKSEQATPAPSAPAHSRADGDSPFRHGRSVAGSPVTWTGKVVSLDEWRRLSEWERHGSTGKVWNGLTRQWEPMGGGAA